MRARLVYPLAMFLALVPVTLLVPGLYELVVVRHGGSQSAAHGFMTVNMIAGMLAVPLLTLGRLVPMSVAGLGGDQALFVALFKAAGVPAARALVIALVMAAVNGIQIAFAGLVTLATTAGRLGRSRA